VICEILELALLRGSLSTLRSCGSWRQSRRSWQWKGENGRFTLTAFPMANDEWMCDGGAYKTDGIAATRCRRASTRPGLLLFHLCKHTVPCSQSLAESTPMLSSLAEMPLQSNEAVYQGSSLIVKVVCFGFAYQDRVSSGRELQRC